MTPETKMTAPSPEARAAMHELFTAFESFKEANDRRLDEIEAKRAADPLLEDKLARIDRALTQTQSRIEHLTREAARPALGDGEEKSASVSSWSAYLRSGDAARLSEAKALSVGSPGDGGHVAPGETEAFIERLVREISPIRQIATVKQTTSHTFKKPVSRGGALSGWVAETAARPQTDTSTLDLIEFPTAELYAMPAATPAILDDALVDMEQWLAEEVREVFAEAEGNAFVTGGGINQPKGFLSYPKALDGAAAWGEIGYLATGVDGGWAASNPSDALIDLIYAPRAGYRSKGRFVMRKSTVSSVRKFKDLDGNYIWQPAMSAGEPARLLGYPVTESEAMPAIGSNAYAIAFGDFERGYLVVDRQGVEVLRDPYSAKPYVLFYTTRRVGGGVQDFNAIKLLKFGVS